MTRKRQPGHRYRYTLESEGEQPEPLEECPSCNWNLTDTGGVRVELVERSGRAWEVSSQLDSDGVLEDDSGDIASGSHSATRCFGCGDQLIDLDDVVETDIGASKPRPEHLSSPNGCHPDCPACAEEPCAEEASADEKQRQRLIAKARELWQSDEIEIDDDARISVAAGPPADGNWVQAWVWVSDDEFEPCDGCDGTGIRPESTPHSGPLPDGFVAVERCDTCQRFSSDLDAAIAWGGRDITERERDVICRPPEAMQAEADR